jgi:hypothetical protein
MPDRQFCLVLSHVFPMCFQRCATCFQHVSDVFQQARKAAEAEEDSHNHYFDLLQM